METTSTTPSRSRVPCRRLVCRAAVHAATAIALVFAGSRPVRAQQLPISGRWRVAEVRDSRTGFDRDDARAHSPSVMLPAPGVRPAPWWAPAASAFVPGAGQLLLGQQRSVAYLVAEAYLVLQAVSAQRDGDRDRSRYRALASDVARKPFGGARPIGPWEYYESMEKFAESGAFDMVPGGAVDPETDPLTYNGYRWRLARETYWRDPDVTPSTSSPEYARAMNFYTTHAVMDAYRWSWRDAGLEQNTYSQTIASANRSYQRAVNVVGLIGANHLMSLVDAYVSVRIRRFGGAGVAGLRLDGFTTELTTVGDPLAGRRQLRSTLRLAPFGSQ